MNATMRLNGICPYFTMFPLEFPYGILNGRAKDGIWVADPFCGRGTTNYACRLLGLPSLGIDSSPVAAAIAAAKLANSTPNEIVECANTILELAPSAQDVPKGEFWSLAYHEEVLAALCRLREGLALLPDSDTVKALRGIVLGALHGPLNKTVRTYFSNQCQRTYAPKPGYAVRYWKRNNLSAPRVDVLEIIRIRSERYYSGQKPARGCIVKGDSRMVESFDEPDARISWVITSPPYYGLRTYVPDQWLRAWFLGGKPEVDYSHSGQLGHTSPEQFADGLRTVWRNVGAKCNPGARMVVRFGGINDRKADPMLILRSSFADSGWFVDQVTSAGFATQGKRQAEHIHTTLAQPKEEFDVWLTWRP